MDESLDRIHTFQKRDFAVTRYESSELMSLVLPSLVAQRASLKMHSKMLGTYIKIRYPKTKLKCFDCKFKNIFKSIMKKESKIDNLEKRKVKNC